jgi:hypothetical protein
MLSLPGFSSQVALQNFWANQKKTPAERAGV